MGGMLRPFQKPHLSIVVTAILPASNGIAAVAERGWTLILVNFVYFWVIKIYWLKYVEGCVRVGRVARPQDWRVVKSIFVVDDDVMVWRMTHNTNNPFTYYFHNLQHKTQKTR